MTIPRPFTVHYNPYTQSIEVIDGKEQIVNIFRTLRSMKMNISCFLLLIFHFVKDDMDIVIDALRKTEIIQS